MSNARQKALEIYRKFLREMENLRSTATESELKIKTDDGLTVEEEIARIKKHIHNLETDHRDCQTPCSLGCKAWERQDG